MNPERWKRGREIFDAVVTLAGAERDARLTELCAGDADLRRDVEHLLALDAVSDDAIGRAVGAAAQRVIDDTAPVHAGQALLHYRLIAEVGHGGMGVVWRAADATLNRDVAIKVLPPEFVGDRARLARFEREARVLASLSHANIAAVYGLHESDGVHFVAMEYAAGIDLSARLARGPVPLDQALTIARQIAEALEEAHEKGIVHRDLKPANVKVTPDGKVKVLDFGLAKAFGDHDRPDADEASASAAGARETQVGAILGTAAYMAPEQARGLPVDKRADIWAFGVLLFELLSRRRPFADGSVTETLTAVTTEDPDWTRLPADVPPSLLRLLRRCLAKDPRQRLRDIGDARIELEHLAALPPSARFVDSVPAPGPARARRRDVVLLIAGAAVAMVPLLLWRGGNAPPEPLVEQRFNLALPGGVTLEDVIGAGRQSLAVSRDGTLVVYVGRTADGQRHIFRRRLGGLEAERVEGAAGGDMPFLSPDGDWLGFAAEGKLKKVPITGGQPIVIADAPDPRGASWGEDGTIVFAPAVRTGLSRVPSDGAPATALTTVAENEVGHRWPLLLPGGRAALFNVEAASSREEDRAIDLVRLDTGERRTLVRHATDPRYAAGHLMFGRAGRLMAAPFDVARLALTGEAVPVLDDVRMDLRATGRVFAALSSTGVLVYVPGFPRPSERALTWVDRRGRLTPVTGERRAFRAVRLSPDGQRLAVVIQQATDDLWVLDLRRTVWTRLTFAGDVQMPAWTPDGARILFASTQDGPTAVYWVPADGSSAPERLSPPLAAVVDMPSVAPDGGRALVTTQAPRSDDIYSLSLTPPYRFEPFLDSPAHEASPSISPGGRFVAYGSNESGRWEIYVRPYRDAGRRWIVSTAGGSAAKWRRDEEELFYVEGTRMMAVPITSAPAIDIGVPRVLFDEPALAWSQIDFFRFDVTADGERFVIVKPESREVAPLQIVVVPRFGDEIAQQAATARGR